MKRLFAVFLLLVVAGAGALGFALLRPEAAPAPLRQVVEEYELRERLAALGLLPDVARANTGEADVADAGEGGGEEEAPAASGPAASVETAPVKLDRVVDRVEAIGSILANESVTVAPEISGRIAEILVREGTRVEQGAVLFRLDETILRAELSQAQAQLELSEANFDRADRLARQNSGTQRARDEAFAALQQARASIELAQAQLEKVEIRAPFEGIVGLRSVSLGEYVTPGDALVNLASIDPIKVDFRVPEIYLAEVATDQRVTVTVDALPDDTFEGWIYAIDPQVDVNGRSLRLRAIVENDALRLRPGLFARIQIIIEEREDSIIVPESAVVPEGDQRYVYRLENGRAMRMPVRLGQRRAGEVEVLEGIGPDDTVVVAGQQRLQDGAAVQQVAQRQTRSDL